VFRSFLWKTGGNLRSPRSGPRASAGSGVWLDPVWRCPVLLGAGLLGGLWYVFIGWFLNNAAESSYQQVVLRDMLSGVKARDVMTQQCQTVPAETPLDRLVEDNILGQGQRCFFIAEDGDLKV